MKSRSLALLSAVAMVASLLITVPLPVAATDHETEVTVSSEVALLDALTDDAIEFVVIASPGFSITAPIPVARDVTIKGIEPTAEATTLTVTSNSPALVVAEGTVNLERFAITGANDRKADGGGVAVHEGATLNMREMSLYDNFAGEGGALFNAGTANVYDSVFYANEVPGKGGAINNAGTLEVWNSTFASNDAGQGGAISSAGAASLHFVTIVGNSSKNKIGAGTHLNGGSISLDHSIVANNYSGGSFYDCSGQTATTFTVFSSIQGCQPGPEYLVAPIIYFEKYESGGQSDPFNTYDGREFPFDNGGPTKTVAIIDPQPEPPVGPGNGHPAVGYGALCNPPGFDQRGVQRLDTGCTVGAYEFVLDETPPVVTLTADPAANGAGWSNGPVTVTVDATDAETDVVSVTYSATGADPIGETTVSGSTALFVVDAEGLTTATASAVDAAGNVGTAEDLLIKLDLTDPTVDFTAVPDPSTGDVTVTLTPVDNLSGIAELTYDDGSGPTSVTEYPVELIVTAAGTTFITYSATDEAGNDSGEFSQTVTIDPLSFDISMTTSVSEVEVGAVIVPVDNIGTAIRAAGGEGTTTSSTPLSSIPLSSIPLSSIPLSSIPLSSIPLSSIPLSSIPLSSIPLSSIPLSSIPLSSIPLSSIDAVLDCSDPGTTCPEDAGLEYLLTGTPLQGTPLQALNFTDLVSVPLSSIPLSSIPLSSIPLSSIPLSSIPLSSIGNAIDCSVIAGGCGDPNTLEDAFNAGAVLSAGTVGDVLSFDDVTFGATPLSSIPLSSIAMGTTPLSSIPLSSILVPPATDAERLAAWCDALDVASGSDECNLVEAEGSSLMTLALGGIPLSSIPLSSIPLSSIPLSSIPLSSIPLSSIYWTSTPLSSIPLSSIPLSSIPLSSIPLSSIPLSSIPLSSIDSSVIDCSAVNCDDITLGEAMELGAILPDTTLGDIGPTADPFTIADLYNADDPALAAYLDGFSLADLLFGLLVPTEIPWEEIDLNASRLPDAADPKQPAFTYDIELAVGGARTADIEVVLMPPTGFYFARDLGVTGPNYPTDPVFPTTLDGIQVADPVENLATGALSLTLTGISPGTHTLSIAMRAGVILGDHEASVTAEATTSAEGPLPAGPETASITVIEAGETGSGPVPTLIDGELNLSHISRSDDLDFYEFTVGSNLAGASAKILLSNLPADYDLVLYGPPVSAPLRGTPEPGFGVVEDFVFDLSPDDEILDTDTLQDVPHDPVAIPGYTDESLNSISAKRGTNDEEIDTGTLREGRYVVQVSSYNGAFNDLPFGLRIRLSETPQRACTAPVITFGSRGSLPSVIPDGLNTLFLYNHARLTGEYPAADYQQVLDELDRVATTEWTDLGVIGLVVPVDGDVDVWTALQGLQADQCDPEASNNVVRAIGDLIDSYPEVENIVIIGDDAQIPMARILDGTSISNEREHGLTFTGNNELVGALLGGYYLSDIPYGTSAGRAVNDHEFFVPERAVGRLVEHPADIAQALDRFVFYDGLLDPSTAAAATGYDFLSDGTDLIKSELENEGFAFGADDFLNNETWTRQNLINLLDDPPAVASVNAHFDQSRALPALGNSTNDETDLFTVDDVPLSLSRAVLFSMGCHAGLNIPDVQLGLPNPDWAETFGGIEQSIWAANTGYGYGDTELVALSEQITASFAARLGTFPVGKAWQLALQEYAGDLFTLTPYDEKVLQEFTLYGLPMYLTGPAVGSLPGAPPAAGTGPATFNDPFTSLQTASITFDLPIVGSTGPGLHLVSTLDGDYYEVNGETLQVRSRPVQPRTGADVTAPDGNGGLELVAGGALITGLTGVQMTQFDPLYFTPIVDLGDATSSTSTDAFRPEADDATFPAGIQRVATFEDDTGQLRQRVLVVPGRFVARGPDGSNTQELFTSIESLIYYRDPSSADFTPPLIRESIGRVGDGVVHFEIEVNGDGPVGSDDVRRVYVLFRPQGAIGVTEWQGVDLFRVPGTNTWLGGRSYFPFPAGDFEFFVQALDANGNDATSTAKGTNHRTTEPFESDLITITVDPATLSASGWYQGLARITATTAAPNAQVSGYSLDLGGEIPWNGQTPLQVIQDGGHLVQVFDTAGNQGIVFVAVDGSGPVVSISIPADGEAVPIGSTLTPEFSCTDALSGVDTCEADGPVDTTSFGTKTFSVTGTDFAGNSTTATVTYEVGYNVCLLYDPLREQPNSGTVPVKLQLCDADGNNLSARQITLTATQIDGDITPSPNDQGSSNDNFEFRYDRRLEGYIYNLNVDELTDSGGNPVALEAGYHTLGFTVDDVASPFYVAGFTLKE